MSLKLNLDPRRKYELQLRPLAVAFRSQPQPVAIGLTVAWVGLLVYLASLPRLPYVPVAPEAPWSPLAHFATHLMLALLVYLAITRPGGLRQRWLAMTFAFGFSAVLGVGLEGLQSLTTDRATQLSDVLFNITGAAAGAISALTLDLVKVNRKLLVIAALVLTLSLIAVTGASAALWDPSYPRIGDHWHARYQISICGQALSPMPGKPGHVHTHGRGFVHIHPKIPSKAGANANLAQLFAVAGGVLGDRGLTLPSGVAYGEGDRCLDDRPAELVVTVNGAIVDRPSTYVFRDRDDIHIDFQAVASTNGLRLESQP